MNSTRRALYVGVCLALLTTAAAAKNGVVARVGEEKISIADFERRAQAMMKTGFSHVDIEDPGAKQVFLEGIIAHELLAQEGMRRGLDQDTTIAFEVRRVEEQALRAKLYEVEALKGDYSSTEEELKRFSVEREFDTEVLSQHIVSATEEEGWEVLDRLAKGETFEDLFPLYSVTHIQKRFGPHGRVGWFKAGELLPRLVVPFKGMEPGDLYPEPVRTNSGYHVFKLLERRSVDYDENRAWLERRLREVKRGKDMEVYVNELRRRYEMEIHNDAMQKLNAMDPGVNEWPGQDLQLISWSGGELTAVEFLRHHQLARVKHPSSFDLAGLEKAADRLAGREIMITEARSLQLDRDPEIVTKAKTRRDELIIQWLYRLEGQDVARVTGVKDEDVRDFYDKNQQMFTKKDGAVARFDLVSGSIRGALLTHIENRAMDELISRLREERADDVEIYLHGLRRAKLIPVESQRTHGAGAVD